MKRNVKDLRSLTSREVFDGASPNLVGNVAEEMSVHSQGAASPGPTVMDNDCQLAVMCMWH